MEEHARISRMKSGFYVGIVVGLAVAILSSVRVFAPVDPFAYDLALRSTAIPRKEPRIVVIGIAPDDIDNPEFGGFPWSRKFYAQALRNLHDAGAAAVGIDLPFREPADPEGDRELALAIQDFTYPRRNGPDVPRVALSVYASVDLRSDAPSLRLATSTSLSSARLSDLAVRT